MIFNFLKDDQILEEPTEEMPTGGDVTGADYEEDSEDVNQEVLKLNIF